jgi:hypothetical protein
VARNIEEQEGKNMATADAVSADEKEGAA